MCADAVWLLVPKMLLRRLEESDGQMTDAISSKELYLRQRSDELWSRLQTAWLQIPLRKGTGRTSPTWEVFSERFDRCFRRVSLYVSRRVSDPETLERIVTRALAENLELFIAQCDEREVMKRLKASADRLLAPGAAISPDADTASFARKHDVCAARPDQQG